MVAGAVPKVAKLTKFQKIMCAIVKHLPLMQPETDEQTEQAGLDTEKALQGFISLSRGIREHWIWKKPEHLKWWIDLLLEANYKPKTVVIDGHFIECGRGECAISVLSWSKRWLVDRGKVRRFFELLEKDKMILVKGTEKTTIVTICKYDSYQSYRPTTGQQPANNRPQHNKEIKKQVNTNTDIQAGEMLSSGKNGKGKTTNKPAPGPDVTTLTPLPFFTDSFKAKWLEWVEYRKTAKKAPYVTTRAVEMFFRNVVKLSGNNEAEALKLIDYAMGKQWKDVYPINENQKGNNGTDQKNIGKTLSFDKF